MKPRVFIPYTFIHEPTWRLLEPLNPIGIDCRGDDEAYLQHLADRWEERLPFVNIEHDMLVTPEQVWDLWRCNCSWAAHGYDGGPGRFPWLGSVRFSPEFMDAWPDVWRDLLDWAHATPLEQPMVWRLVGEVPMKCPAPGAVSLQEFLPLWMSLDTWLIRKITRDVICHRHYPDVTNCRPADHPKLEAV